MNSLLGFKIEEVAPHNVRSYLESCHQPQKATMNTDSPSLPDTIALRIDEACTASRLSRGTIYSAIGSGALPVVKIGRATRIMRTDLEAWLRSLRRENKAA